MKCCKLFQIILKQHLLEFNISIDFRSNNSFKSPLLKYYIINPPKIRVLIIIYPLTHPTLKGKFERGIEIYFEKQNCQSIQVGSETRTGADLNWRYICFILMQHPPHIVRKSLKDIGNKYFQFNLVGSETRLIIVMKCSKVTQWTGADLNWRYICF